MTKADLFKLGRQRVDDWCCANHVEIPRIEIDEEPTRFDTCAYYRDGLIVIWPPACAGIGMCGRAWSYPGYVVDRTPYGVLCHELGHHVEEAHGPNGGLIARRWAQETLEEPITSYSPNVNEWFAEMFRLYVTNPSLLSVLRPKVYALLFDRWPHQIETRIWTEILSPVPRQLAAAYNKITEVNRRKAKSLSLF